MKDFADNNFKFYENGGKLSIQVENTIGKKRNNIIAHYEQFLHFPHCFQKICSVKSDLCGKRLPSPIA